MAESLKRNLYSHKASTLNGILGNSLMVVKKQLYLYHKYEISKILHSQIKEQSFIFVRIYICENCICVLILSPMKINAPAADLLNVSI